MEQTACIAHRLALLGTSFIFALSAGCAATFPNGGRIADGSEKERVIAKYSVEGCMDASSGSELAVPSVEYWLIRDNAGTALVEVDENGQSTVLTNAWNWPDADHYFTWSTSTGWEYLIPRDHSRPGARLVYTDVATADVGYAIKPVGAAQARCVLKPQVESATNLYAIQLRAK